MNNTGILLILAYPETIVTISKEWFSPYLRFLGIGRKNYLRAGHAALILINKSTGILEYHDFGRYITSEPYGRVRGKKTDAELDFPIIAKIKNDEIKNLDAILFFLATHPKFTHGDGKLIVSSNHKIDYHKARVHINDLQKQGFIRYAAFMKQATNCARFVTNTLIASTTDIKVKKQLIKSKRFTPSTVGNVIIGNTNDNVYEVNSNGKISIFKGSQRSENWRCFLDQLRFFKPTLKGTLKPKHVNRKDKNAQWLSGIAAGAWFELHKTRTLNTYRFRRISPYNHIDIDAAYSPEDKTFNINENYQFVHYSNCLFFNIKQNGKIYRFNKMEI